MADTLSMITADLAAPSAPASTAPPVSDETTAEVNEVPGDEDVQEGSGDAELPDQSSETQEEAPAEPSEDEKPNIPNLDDNRWKKVHSGYKYARELGKALGVVGEDGRVDVSLFPSVDEIVGMQTAYSDRLAMEHDFASADPENAQQWLQNWNEFSPQGMQTVAAAMPDYLAQTNPAAYQAVAMPVLTRAIEFMYQRGASFEDPAMRDYVLSAARSFEWWLHGGPDAPPGSYRDDTAIQQLMQRGKTNAPSQTERQLAEARAQLNGINKQTAQARWDGFYSSAVSEINANTAKLVDSDLAPLKAHYPNELSFNAVKQSYIGQVQQTLNKDTQGRRLYDLAVEKAKRTQSDADKQAIVTHWTNMVRRAAQTTRGKFVSEASKGVKAASDAKHKALAAGASKVGPTSGGAPRQQSIIPELKRNPGETIQEFNFRRIAADMSR